MKPNEIAFAGKGSAHFDGSLRDALQGAGLAPVKAAFTFDGQPCRFDIEGRKRGKKHGWFIGYADGDDAWGVFGDWQSGYQQSWCSRTRQSLSAEELTRLDERMQQAQAAAAAERQRMAQAAAAKAAQLWEKGAPVRADHPYIAAKGIHPVGALQLRDMLLIPLRRAGALLSMQCIGTDGRKTFLTGGETKGAALVLGTLKDAGQILLCEGWATGCTLHEATGLPVVVAFNAGNLLPVAERLVQTLAVPVLVCGDNDQATEGNPGKACAEKAAAALFPHGRAVLPSFTAEQIAQYQQTHDGKAPTDFNDLHQLQGLEAVKQQLQARMQAPVKPLVCQYGGGRFECSERGVYFIGTSKDGNEEAPLWLCSPLQVQAKTRDAKSREWGRLLSWQDEDQVMHQWAMPLELLQGDGLDVRRELACKGLTISPSKRTRDLLISYLQVWPVQRRARCVDRLGWHGDVYVTPTESIGQKKEIIVFQNAQAIEPAFSVSGSVGEWQESVAALACGNSRLVFALSVAFAGALADLAAEDAGGFHLRGGSSTGKSTALQAAASVWGHPATYPRLWRATTNALEALAALHNDGLLILDELSQLDPKEAGQAAYTLANGQGKSRATRTGTARPAARWRLLFLSAGEESLSALMARAGHRSNAGQEIRLADIEADAGAGMGAFETLHGQTTPAALALAIKDAAIRYHGAVGLAWLRYLVADRAALIESIADGIRQFVQENTPADAAGQVQRVARRFALVAVAGELASHYGLTGWPEGEADNAARLCFAAWLDAFGGTGNREERAMLSQVRAFFEAHGTSRFEDVKADQNQRIINRAGFYRQSEDGKRVYLVLPEAFKREVCQGLDVRAATATLIKSGWIEPGTDGKSTQKPRLPGIGPTRCYVFSTRLWEDEGCV